jgi:ArsR family metal-binding transcriptional regulator
MFKNEDIMRQVKDHIDMGGSVMLSKGSIPIPKEYESKYSLSIYKGDMIISIFNSDFDKLPYFFDRKEAESFRGRMG